MRCTRRRRGGCLAAKLLRGRIHRARLYDRALTPEEVRGSATGEFDFVNEEELLEFRSRFGIPISDDDVAKAPFYKPAEDEDQPVISCIDDGDEVVRAFSRGAIAADSALPVNNDRPCNEDEVVRLTPT